MADLRENVDVAMENISSVLPPELEKIKGMCLAAVKKPRDYTRFHEINTEILWKSV